MACIPASQAGGIGKRPNNYHQGDYADSNNITMKAMSSDDVGFERDVRGPRIVDDAASSIEDNNSSFEQPTAVDNNILRSTANDMAAALAEEGRANAQAQLASVMDALSGSSAKAASRFSNIASTLSTQFLHGMGDMFNYATHFFGVDGRHAQDHPFWSALTGVLPKTEALRGVFKNDFDNWRSQYRDLANRSSLSQEEFFTEIGNLAVYEHMPERNQKLLADWQRQLDEVYAKQDAGVQLTRDEVKILEEFPDQIQKLRDNLNEAYAQFNEKGERTVRSGGYLDGEAARLWNETIARLGISEDEARAATAGLRDVHARIRDYALQNGIHDPAAVANWPEYQMYVPVKTDMDITSGPTGDAHVYDPGRYYHTEGMVYTPGSAYKAIANYAERVAHSVGQQPLAQAMQAMWVRQFEMRQQDPNFDAGIRSYEYDKVVNSLRSREPAVRAWAERIYKSEDGGGVVVDVPTRRANGDIVLQRRLITFDPNWKDEQYNTGVTGAMLNQALTQASKFGGVPSGTIGRIAARGTSMLSQLTTRFNPLFPVGNMFRDSFERMSHLAGRDYTLDNGTVINGSSLLGSYSANLFQAATTLAGGLRRTLPDGPAKQYLDEYMRNGLHYQPTMGILPKKVDITADPNLKGFRQKLDESVPADVARKLLSKWDGYNDYFNNVAPLAHYITLREAGMSEARAASNALELMNLYQSGKMSTGLQALYPFIRPTMQSAAAMARTFGFAPNARGEFQMNYKGWLGMLGATVGYAALMPIMRESMGTNDRGEYLYDLEPIENLTRALLFGGLDSENTVAKIPLGFGPSQVAVSLAVGMDRVMRGTMAPEDVLFNTLKAMGRNVTPQDWPSYSVSDAPLTWLAQSFAPMTLRPLLDAGMNVNWMGREIYTRPTDASVAKAISGRTGTPEVYSTIAKDLLKYTGTDLAPEQVRALFNGYFKGIGRLVTGMLEDGNLKAAGLDENTRQMLGPFGTAIGATMFVGKATSTDMMQFYNEFDEFNTRIRRAGIKLTSPTYGNDPDKRRAYWTQQLQDNTDFTPEEITKYIALREANNNVNNISREFGTKLKSDPNWIDEDDDVIREMFEQYNTDKLAVMRAFLEEYE